MTSAPTSPELISDLSAEELSPGKAVTLLQRILMPRPADPRKLRTLYLDEERAERIRVDNRSTGHLSAGDEISFATYFNAFPASYWRRWTVLTSVVQALLFATSGWLGGELYRFAEMTLLKVPLVR